MKHEILRYSIVLQAVLSFEQTSFLGYHFSVVLKTKVLNLIAQTGKAGAANGGAAAEEDMDDDEDEEEEDDE